jgi:hypothetical protein
MSSMLAQVVRRMLPILTLLLCFRPAIAADVLRPRPSIEVEGSGGAMAPAEEAALWRAMDKDGITPAAIVIHSGGGEGWLDSHEVVIVYGAAGASSPGVCRGNAWWYAPSERNDGRWERAPLALGYAIVDADRAQACRVGRIRDRILLIGNPSDAMVVGILEAIRSGAFSTRGSDEPLRRNNDLRILELLPDRKRARVETSDRNGAIQTLLLDAAGGGWSVVSTSPAAAFGD